MMIKRRKAKISKRGIYIQDKELLQTRFLPSSPFVYEIDIEARCITIRRPKRTEKANNRVSKRSMKEFVKPVIDIRDKSALNVFKGAEHLEILIAEDHIRVIGMFPDHSALLDTSTSDLNSASSSYQYFEEAFRIAEPLLDHFKFSKSARDGLKLSLDVISLFSGAGIMDEGFVQEGFQVKFALEKDPDAVLTYQVNHLNEIALTDIRTFDKRKFNDIGATVMIGGSPCQGFSNVNRKTNFLDNPNNLLVKEFIESIKSNPNCKVFVLENVPRLLTAGDGRFKEEIMEELGDFNITTGVLCAADYGAAQYRKRAFMIGSKIGPIQLPKPTHNAETHVTVGQALAGLTASTANQNDYTLPREDTVHRMAHIKPGSNWRDLPDELMSEGMKQGKTHSNVFKRLCLNKPSIALPNFRKSNILHPSENRILSVRECARLFGINDVYIFAGSLASMQQMVCNSVPVQLAKAIANAVKRSIQNYNCSLSN